MCEFQGSISVLGDTKNKAALGVLTFSGLSPDCLISECKDFFFFKKKQFVVF